MSVNITEYVTKQLTDNLERPESIVVKNKIGFIQLNGTIAENLEFLSSVERFINND